MTAIILKDVDGYPERLRALRDAHPHVWAVSPPDRPHAHTIPVHIPEDWLPADPQIPFAKKCWFRGHVLGLAAVQQLGIGADHYWFIESDCVASQDRWKALFSDHAANPADCISNPMRARADTPGDRWWSHPGTPPWASHFFLPACHRLSSRAVAELIRTAAETREFFCEHALGSTLMRAGFSCSNANHPRTHWNQQTYRTRPEAVILNPDLLNHPVKADTYRP